MTNYETLPNGVIHQKIIINKIKDYDVNYVDERYNSYGEKGLQMAYLRYGFMKGVIKEPILSILDVGYGNGDFLKVCSSDIKNCYGNDISEYPLPENVLFTESLTDNYYDVITFFDSLEHFEDIDFVKNLKCEYIYISVPFCHNFNSEWFHKWKHRRVDEHLWHFNDGSLNNFMESMGFQNVSYSSVEDNIRKPDSANQNILSGVFKRFKS